MKEADVKKLLAAATATPEAADKLVETAQKWVASGLGSWKPEVVGALTKRLVEVAESRTLPPSSRIAAGRLLGEVGDPRDQADAHVTIAHGDCIRGSKDHDDEGPMWIVYCAPFAIGKYPVTNAWYRKFVEAGGYGLSGRKLWDSNGWHWREMNSITGPKYIDHERLGAPNSPVVGVSYFEACAFAKWAGLGARLPSEGEWERAARGTGPRRYTWGDEWKPDLCNTAEMGIGTSVPIGCFSGSDSPDGVCDLLGNVREWTASPYGPYEGAADHPGMPSMQESTRRVIRGGSWQQDKEYATVTRRQRSQPDTRDSDLGFRLAFLP
jgi:formylglycine-generating enzyme required for sulfatase activity